MNLIFKQFKIMKIISIYRAYHRIEIRLARTDKYKEIREYSVDILKKIQYKRTRENYRLYKKLIKYANKDKSIKNALSQIELGKDISKIALNFDQFTIVNARSIGTAYNRLDVAAKNSRINRAERRDAADKLRRIQHAEMTKANYKLHREVVEYAENKDDKTAINALDKIEYDSSGESN